MLEENLAILFKDHADEIERHREALTARIPEVEPLCEGIDELTRFLRDQARMLQAMGGGKKKESCSEL